ncbi:hypothetical protein [Pedobacter metabolipauper]|uniref:Uncharacterized protein n=1 Tax=Pedobacter metabolipauper TaxID=425513 RepID=A0A4V6PW11_9SPHI|nr:hypothetical protein [Pedobacter metabolipauper]TDQ09477.1 hypothetical protein ATK78_1632 [Pedobacter metabolipauper]
MKKANINPICTLIFICSITLLLNKTAQAQPAGTTNFLNNIKAYNLAALWRADQLRLISLKQNEPFPEPYGILGKNHQRFYIHYTKVTKDPANPYLYTVQGKTRVGNQVRSFTGTITVMHAGIYKDGSEYAPETYKGYKRGLLVCHVVISEAGQAPGGGIINGELTTGFCINVQNQLLYDTLDFGIDGYENNQFTGNWTARGSKAAQRLQYGDFGLTGSEFSDVSGITVPSQYEKYGWQSFVNAIPNDFRPASKAAIAEEKRQWWK